MKLALIVALFVFAAGKVHKGKGLQQGGAQMNEWPAAEPGTTKRLPRPYPGAPALIPHGVEGLAITREDNACLGCHLEGMEVAEGHKATKVPPSHFVNPHTKEKKTDTVVGMRYQCLQCHAPQTSATPPVPVGKAR